MKIEISLDTKDAADMAALMALVGSLGAPRSAASAYPNSATITTPDGNSFTVGAGPVSEIVEGLKSYDPREPEDAEDDGAPAPIVTNPEGAPDVDSRGLPWDERIHASTKATNGDGSWRNKRGVDKALLEAVEAELAGGVSVPPSPTDEPVATASGAADVAGASRGNSPAATVSGADVAAGASEIPLPPAPGAEEADGIIPDAPAAPTPADAPTFKDAMAIVTTRQREGTLTQVQVSEAAQALGLSSVVDLAKPANAEHIAAFIALLG